MKTLFLSEKAYDDLLQILRYIARDKPQVAARFIPFRGAVSILS